MQFSNWTVHKRKKIVAIYRRHFIELNNGLTWRFIVLSKYNKDYKPTGTKCG